MITYRVGGAVRDKLLGIPAKENDWVVVGSAPDELLSSGFTPVGKDFPVFLHPQSREEYALARTERKTGRGYHGFHFHAAPDVTLEQDLLRRDLTINAIAEDAAGNLIDPYGGQRDIEARLLRHVSPAFAEDPVRVLRVARFAARFSPYGFSIAQDTMSLMQQIVESDEVDHLVPERIWKETVRALSEDVPAVFFRVLRECGALNRIFPELEHLFGVPQRADYHPEIDCGVHALLSLEQATLLSPDPAVRFAALVHDLGKATTPVNILPSHTAHETRSLPLIRALCSRLTVPNDFRDLALLVARYHTDVHRALQLRPATILKLFDACDVWRRPQRFPMLLAACKADARGRTTFENASYLQADYLMQCMDAARSIDNNALINAGYSGVALGGKIQEVRLQLITRIKMKWKPDDNTDK